MAEGAGITRYLNESLRISKALQTFLEARHACEVQYATALAEACYTLKGTVESKVETEGKLQNSLLKQAVMDLIKGTGKIADARYGFAGTMKKNVLDHFSSVILELQTTRDAKIAEMEHLQDPIIESFENYKKAKTLNDAVKETEKEAKDSYSKAQQEQKKKDLEKLSQKATVLAQKVAQTTQAVTDSLLEHDTTRNTYLKETLPNFQKSLVDWAYLRTKTIKYMLLELKSLEQVAVDKALEANNVGKDSAMSIDVQRIVDQFVDTVISKDIEIRKTSATSIRDLKTSTKAGKLYVKRNDSPLSPWSIQYSVLKNNRLYMFENAESEQPKEVILLAKKQEGAHTWNPEKQKKPSASDRVSSDFAIVHPAHRSLFQKDNCFQLLFHANASAASFPLEAPSQETTEVSMESSMFYQEEDDRNIRQSLSMRRGVDSTGERPLDRRYYFMPVDKEASNMWLSAFSQNGAKNCWCGKCLSNQPSKLNLKLWILDGTALGMERGSNDSFGVIVKFGGLKMSRTAFKQGPNPVWNEEFLFEGVTSCTSSIRLAVNSGLNLDNGDSELGTVSFSMSTMALERRTENVVCGSCLRIAMV
ncbi:hypothetical protein BCR33DRAFT_258094 [Rhizoclosmatium globosum]|uniref:C2 domain-containing protein n=1 Tax=Rhizoclosmatium globosum TaxID=329046 RepID=A0A1Y2C8R1_9FUNG|nr:hypothetical protein BCR33DRAFT_258094 [Rhizoclosmatium globosum]|eukprot:ORY43326.1 hypothetical protein BCR33DRAFT_258094 [Rhizoclosmatium globosum]